MKNTIITLTLAVCMITNAKHLGNFNNQLSEMNISRANIETAEMGNTGYDIVVNTDIQKPVIQLGMDLSLRYIPKPVQPDPAKPIKEPKTKVYVISSQGPVNIKQLPNY